MSDSSLNTKTKLLSLEPEYYEKAKKISDNIVDEKNQWKTYLNELAVLGFEKWLKQQLPEITVKREHPDFKEIGIHLQIDKFKMKIITLDNHYDDFITISEDNIISPNIAVHFYVLVDVLEEDEQLKIYGLIRHDELSKNIRYGICKIPISDFDSEINNLLLYTSFLKPEAIPLPKPAENITPDRVISQVKSSIKQASHTFPESLINLAQWWSGVFEDSWKSLEEIVTPQTPTWGCIKSSVKSHLIGESSSEYPIKKGKLFDFGLLLNGKRFALVVKMKHQDKEEKGVLVQILNQNIEDCLPQGLKLKVTLNHNVHENEEGIKSPESRYGINSLESRYAINLKESRYAIARECDQIIQLAFSETSGTQFKVEAIYQDVVITEEFVL